MPTLQVRDVPEGLYKRLTLLAKAENRSIAQQTIVLLQDIMNMKQCNKDRRTAIIKKLQNSPLVLRENKVDPVELIRADRDR